MESTGVEGMPVSESLEARGGQVHRVNARHLKHVPGCTTEGKDCQGIQSLQTCGLLRAACRPDAAMCALRASGRHRATWRDDRAAHLPHMQKALQQMHLPWPQVRTERTGTTGLALIRAIVAGQRDPVHLARCRAPCGAHRTEAIAQALTGHDRAEHVFALPQALALDDVDTAQVRECDAAIARTLHAMTPMWDDDVPPRDRPDKALSHRKHAPAYEARSLWYQLTGVDLVAIPGLHASTGQTILAEIGLDLGKWPHARAFCAWLGLAPRHEISGGNALRRSTLQTRNRAGQALR
jgi:transposase